ncbi:MAG: Gfo/Idh/MocA family oxidoreductase [Bacteroidales bacterium]|nr:Gfo/Idh/MocA family oxidoreductase [Bacteroidales bacterium]
MIKWGIIGCGNVTEVKSGPAFNLVKNSKLVAVMRRDAAKAKDYAIRHKVSRWYDDAEKLISDPEVNAVYVATPPSSHAEYAIKAMKAGKVAYVEKPMAANYKECLEMIKVSEQTGSPLYVAYYRRMLPGFLKVRELIETRKIGKPLHFSIRFLSPPHSDDFKKPLPWRVIPEISGGGYIYDLGSHQLDIIDYFFGPIKEVSSLVYNRSGLYEPEDFASAGFLTENGITGTGLWDFAAPEYLKEDKMTITGEKGKIEFSCFGFTPVKFVRDGISRYYAYKRPAHVQQALIQSIVDELTGKGTCPGDVISAARTSKVLDMITKK